MPGITKQLLVWTPRLLCLLYAAFASLFAADVLSEGLGFWQTLLALAIHLVPTGIILSVLAIAWRWELLGGLLLVLVGLIYMIPALSRHHLDWILVISGPLFGIGGLFLLNWRSAREPRSYVEAVPPSDANDWRAR